MERKRGRERSAGLRMKKPMKSCSFDFGSSIVLVDDYLSENFESRSIVMLSPSDEEEDNQVKCKTLVGPPKFKTLVGSCNGLVCIIKQLNEICLWNPSTGEHRILPKSQKLGDDRNNSLVGFGCDIETKDYKVVRITGLTSCGYCFRPGALIECLCQVQVYNLSTDSWRLLEGVISLPGDIFLCQDDVLYLNGSCFFQAKFFHTRQQPCFPEGNRFILSFDFTKEIFNPIQLPDHHRDQKLYLRSLGDKIALFTKSYHSSKKKNHNAVTSEGFYLWLLKEHSSRISNSIVNKESWTKLHFFQIKPEFPGESNVPLGLSNDGQFVLLQTRGTAAIGNKVKLFHLLSKEVKQNFLSDSLVLSKAHAYKPSLVSIIGGNGSSGSSSHRG